MFKSLWFETPNISDENKWELIRQKRDGLLSESDWMIARCYELGIEIPIEILEYRQKLRDIPQEYANPDDAGIPQATSIDFEELSRGT